VEVVLSSRPYLQAEAEEVEEVEEEAEEESLQAHQEVEEEVEEPLLDPPLLQENWEATHQRSSTVIERKARPSYSTFSSIEE